MQIQPRELTAEQVSRLRIIKKLNRRSRGAIRLAEQFGSALVCVRYRVDDQAKVRFTTVELLVGRTRIHPKNEGLVAVRVKWEEHTLREVISRAGARWDSIAKVWRMPRRLAGILRLTDRIEPR
jgi:hypothetical protein